MNKLIALAAAGIAGLLVARRKTLKDDSERLKSAAKDGAAKVNERVRGESNDEETLDEDTVLELIDDSESAENVAAKVS
jgi:hypothetical protein